MKISKDYLRQLIKEELELTEEEGGNPASGSVLGAGKNIAAVRQYMKPLNQHASMAKLKELVADPVGRLAVAEVLLTDVLGVDPKLLGQKKANILTVFPK